MHSPLFIEIALHYHYSPEPWPAELMHGAQCDVHRELEKAGLIRQLPRPNGTTYWAGVTEPLRLYAEALGAVPLPVHKWVMPEPAKLNNHEDF